MKESYRKVFSLALRLVGNSVDAEDLVQEAYVRAYRFFDRYDDNLPFSSWMYRIVTNCHIDQMRRKGKIKSTSLDTSSDTGAAWEIPDESDAPDRLLMQDQMDEAIQLGLQAMTPDFRTAVVLADVEGMAYEEIADVMKTSIGTVRSRIHRGRKQLRTYLQRKHPERFREVLI